MNDRIQNAFKNGKAFIGFLTGGDPSIEKSEEFILEMVRAGADLIEIGIPFSDPIAEGPVIQKADIRALNDGATVDKIFASAARIRQKADVPLVFLTYLNPVFRCGYGNFFRRCAEAGVDGVIIPDLPFEEQGEARAAGAKTGVDLISLVAPTSAERIRAIAKAAKGFVYVVSSMGVTGVRSRFETDVAALVRAVKAETSVPAAVGFGVSAPDQAAALAVHADGVIVGSAIVRLVEQYGANAGPYIYDYVKKMKQALRR
ncbi:tryptophan synthase alpha chain [Clostridia bacterium]|nr:tryptophan synthase alpha chain [Clostridia bacterium]